MIISCGGVRYAVACSELCWTEEAVSKARAVVRVVVEAVAQHGAAADDPTPQPAAGRLWFPLLQPLGWWSEVATDTIKRRAPLLLS